MPSDPKIRASDADRDRTAALLREHLAAGRLTSEEFNERLDKAYAAKTMGELDQLLADLPGIDLYHLPDHSVERRRGGAAAASACPGCSRRAAAPGYRPPGGRPGAPGSRSASSRSWPGCSAGHPGNLWFLWVAGPYGIILFGRWMSDGSPQGRRSSAGNGALARA